MNPETLHHCPSCGHTLDKNALPFFIAATNTVSFRGKSVVLTPLELDVMESLLDAYPRYLSRAQLFDEMYSDRQFNLPQSDNIVTVMICRIRKRFERAGLQLEIVARKGWADRAGYALKLLPVTA